MCFFPHHSCVLFTHVEVSFSIHIQKRNKMATASSNLSKSREYILNRFQVKFTPDLCRNISFIFSQEITALNIEDAICFLDQYDWKLDVNQNIFVGFFPSIHFLIQDIINDYYNGIEVKQKPTHNPSKTRKNAKTFLYFFISDLGRFYSIEKDNEQHDEDSDRHYAELLQEYGDADDWARAQQSQQYSKAKVNY